MGEILGADTYQRATETAAYVRSKLPSALQNPKVAIVCGSGLGGLADTIDAESKVELPYSSIPNFSKSAGELLYFYEHISISMIHWLSTLADRILIHGIEQSRDMPANSFSDFWARISCPWHFLLVEHSESA